jgi:hypothetical protein
MKKTNKKNSKMRKLLPAFAMLTVSAISLSSATYAWFTMNKEVTVTGMSLKTKVGSNLLVCQTNVEADYTDDLVQNRSALLEPVSTINATDSKFFYTVNAAADGHWMQGDNSMKTYSEAAVGDPATNTNSTATAIGKTNYDLAFNTTYGITPGATTQFDTAYGYVDYVFFLKATSDADASAINLTECNLVYDNTTAGSGDYAWRVAIFAEEINDKGNGTTNQDITSATTDLVSILDIKDYAKNWNEGTAAINTVNPQAISAGAGTKAAVTNANTAVSFGSIDAGDTAYYKVVARVWLEGEDQSCNSATYADLSDKIWELGLQFELNQGTAVDTISSVTNNDTGEIMTAES